MIPATVTQAVRARAWDDALVGLLALFRARPHPRVAELVGKVSALAEKGLPAIAGKNLDARLAAAEALLEEGRPRDLPRVLRLLRELRIAQAKKLVEALSAIEGDPRVLDAALVLLRDPPFASSTAMPFWRAFLAVVDRQGDPRTPAALAALDFSWLPDWSAENFRTACARAGVKKGANRGAAPQAVAVELRADEEAACAEIEAALGGSQVDGAALLAAIHARPDDDATRAVYADWLEEQGDPRGKLVSLQLATRDRAPTDDERKAMKALLDAHEEAWLGDLSGVLRPDRIRFGRGFIAAAAVLTDELPRLVASEHVATLETLWLIPHGDFDAALLRAPTLRGLRLVGGIEPPMLGALREAGPFPFEGIGLDLFDVLPGKGEPWTADSMAVRRRIVDLRATFPALIELAIRAWYRDPAELDFVWASPLAVGLERLRLSCGGAPFWLARQDLLPKTVAWLEVSFDFGFCAWTTELRRDEQGRFSRVIATLRPGNRDFAAVKLDDIVRELLDEVPTDALTDVEVRAEGVRVTQAALDAITHAAQRHTRLRSLRLPGRPPLDVGALARPAEPVLTTKERDRRAHAARAQEIGARIRTAAEGLMPEETLALLGGLDFGATETLERARAWLPVASDVDPRWAEVVLLLLSIPRPTEPPKGYRRAHDALAVDGLRVCARARLERPFTRLRAVLDNLSPQDALSVIAESAGTPRSLVWPEELPAVLDWFEARNVKQASDTYYAIKDLIAKLGGPGTRDDLQRRLASRKLNRFHRWTYESQ